MLDVLCHTVVMIYKQLIVKIDIFNLFHRVVTNFKYKRRNTVQLTDRKHTTFIVKSLLLFSKQLHDIACFGVSAK